MKKERWGYLIFTALLVLIFVHTAAAQPEFTAKIQELADKLTSTTSGKVIGIDGDIIYINLGEKDSVYEGAQFEVVRLGDVMIVDGKHYYKERSVGIIQITKVRKEFSHAVATAIFEPIQKNDKVYQTNNISPVSTPQPTPDVRSYADTVIEVEGIDLQSVFRRLESGGFSPGPYREDDLSRLSDAVRRFQKFSRLPETGTVDASTWAKLKILYDPMKSEDGGTGESERPARRPQVPPPVQPSVVKKVNTIALIEFPYGNGFNLFTRNVYESMSVQLVQKGFQVVERSKLDQVMEQQQLNHSGIIDISTAQRLGKLLGSEIVLLGSVSDMGNSLAIRARMVDVEKGLALTAAEVSFNKTPDIVAMISNTKYPGNVGPTTTVSNQGSGRGNDQNQKLFYENDAVRIDVLSFDRTEEGLVLKLKFVNKTKNDNGQMKIYNPKERSYLVDNNGNRYGFKNSELVEYKVFPVGIPLAYTIVFRDLKSGSKEFTLSSYISGYGLPDFTAKISGLTL